MGKRSRDERGRRLQLEPVVDIPAEQGDCRFARALGSVDKETRDQGVEALARWLAVRENVDEFDLLKIWKGLFYCFWHSDKAKVQEDLAEKLAHVMVRIPPAVAKGYYRAGFWTLKREWAGIDGLRMDKFLLLVRKLLRGSFTLLESLKWDKHAAQELSAFLTEDILLPKDPLHPVGLSYHACDVYGKEMLSALSAARKHPSAHTHAILLRPFVAAVADGGPHKFDGERVLIRRALDGVFGPVLEEFDDPKESRPLAHLDIAHLAADVFRAAADENTRQSSRDALYDLHARIRAAIKRAETAGRMSGQLERLDGMEAAALDEAAEEAHPVDPELRKTGKQRRKERKLLKQAERAEALKEAVAAEEAELEEREAEGQVGQARGGGGRVAAEAEQKKRKLAKDGGGVAAERGDAGRAKKHGGAKDHSGAHVEKGGAAARGVVQAARDEAGARDGGGGDVTPPPKKRVRFSMKQNLIFNPEGPPPPAHVRTPPRAAPRGSALKRTSRFGHVRDVSGDDIRSVARGIMSSVGGTPGSAPPKIGPPSMYTPSGKIRKMKIRPYKTPPASRPERGEEGHANALQAGSTPGGAMRKPKSPAHAPRPKAIEFM
ncbi:unnamed protein product [Pedinophyceae sp. YPF-701]|nr:unnamed protein product [Pedinophyceae sp. YPF-701]